MEEKAANGFHRCEDGEKRSKKKNDINLEKFPSLS